MCCIGTLIFELSHTEFRISVCANGAIACIENPKPSRGRGEWLGDEKPVSWREKLRRKIDEVLPSCATFELIQSSRAAA
ncbi:MAG: hypothetical protein LBN02_05415 [Oscillospiraceae bacterium]|nr:hypothetical protein [Oscillospiraceae bacterium]